MRGWRSSEEEVWNRVSAAAARPTHGYQRRHRRRPSRSSRCRTSGPAAHDCRDWDHQPATDRAFFTETRFQEALQKAAAVIALQECSGRPSARRPRDTGVIKITPCINNQISAVYEQLMNSDVV